MSSFHLIWKIFLGSINSRLTDGDILLSHGFPCIRWDTGLCSFTCPAFNVFFPSGCSHELSFSFIFSFIRICLRKFFFVFTLLEVLCLFDLWLKVFHEFWKSISYYSIFFFYPILFIFSSRVPNTQFHRNQLLCSISVFQVSKLLLSLAWFNGISFHVLDYW